MKTLNKIKFNEVEFFQNLTEGDAVKLKSCLKQRNYKKGEVLFLEKNLCERIFVIRSGRIKIFRSSSSGREQIVDILGPGETCACNPGDINWTCSASGIALTDCQTWYLSHHDYVHLMQTSGSLMRSLNKILAKKMCRLSALVESLSLDSSEKRLIKFLIDAIDDKSKKNLLEDKKFIVLSHEQIANQLGTARETVTRHFHTLKKLKLIKTVSRKISVPNRDALSAYFSALK